MLRRLLTITFCITRKPSHIWFLLMISLAFAGAPTYLAGSTVLYVPTVHYVATRSYCGMYEEAGRHVLLQHPFIWTKKHRAFHVMWLIGLFGTEEGHPACKSSCCFNSGLTFLSGISTSFGHRSLKFQGSVLWNRLPSYYQNIQSSRGFLTKKLGSYFY